MIEYLAMCPGNDFGPSIGKKLTMFIYIIRRVVHYGSRSGGGSGRLISLKSIRLVNDDERDSPRLIVWGRWGLSFQLELEILYF
jgi:hypothetical protein